MKSLCEKMEQLIIDYALNELEESEKQIVEQHVHACSECWEILEGTRNAISAVSQSEMLDPPEALCESVRRGVREQLHGKRRVFSLVGDVASSFVRRPAFAVASALAAVAAMMLLVFLPGPQDVGQQDDGDVSPVGRGGEARKSLGTYLSECDRVLDMVSRPGAAEMLSLQGRDYWVRLKGQAMSLQEKPGLGRYTGLLSDLESLYGMFVERGGRFTPDDMDKITEVISDKSLAQRVRSVLKARR